MRFKRKRTSSSFFAMQCSAISQICLDGRDFFVKRDDLFDPYLSGNKYRKLYTLLKTPQERYHTLVSYGGTQSNAMLAIAALAKRKSWRFVYYTKPLSKTQQKYSQGNFQEALRLGMVHQELPHELYKEYVASLHVSKDEGTCIVEQGGSQQEAQHGIAVLSDEVQSQLALTKYRDISAVATPSGTGTTALFLAKYLPTCKVYTVACVGDTQYLRTQMQALVPKLPSNLIILEPEKKYHFAKPYEEFYSIYKKLLQTNIEFDLLYAPLMWQELLRQTDEQILYIHSGGVLGNKSMLPRYEKKFQTLTNTDS